MAQSQIRWKRGDFIALGKAVNNFNKKVSEFESLEKKMLIPEKFNYKELRERITTRSELKRVLNSLKRVNDPSAFEEVKTPSGETITKWQRKEVAIERRIASRRITKELKELNKPVEGAGGFTRAQMGDPKLKTLESYKERLEKFEELTGGALKRWLEVMRNLGASDYTFRKALVYRENYIEEMKKYAGFKNYAILVEKMNSLSNPIEFFEALGDNELIQDLTYNSDTTYSQEEFNRFVEKWGRNSPEIRQNYNIEDSIDNE